ncbi:hypothetical protein ACROYT_G032079 [Oculina patagonica]
MEFPGVVITGIVLSFVSFTVTAGNLALRQPASIPDGDVTAALAVDGNPQTCAATSPLTDPWWRVDLEMSYIVEEVKITSGANGITNFEIRIGDSLDDEGNSNQQCGGLNTMTSSQVISYHCAPGIRGRYVNIRIAGDNKILEICEVLVNPNPTVNVALQKSASQSSQCCGGSPGRAVDGNSDGDFSNGLSCSHTAEATDPWWRVDLGSSQSVSEVFLVNRISGQARLSDIEIRVGDNSNGNLNPRCGGLYSMATLFKASFYCKPRKTGRYLNIRLLGSGKFLTLCEVEVYSESRASYKTKTIETIDVYEDSVATLRCPEPFGYPEPLVAWVKNDVILQSSSPDMTLNLTNVKRDDNGSVIDCVVSNTHGSDYHRFILNVKNRFSMCTDFTDIMNDARTVLSQLQNNVSRAPLNDSDISPAHWYRFVDHVTREPMKLPDSCQDPLTCGTQAPGWLRGGHPTIDDNVVQRTVCFSWDDNCCFAELLAHVRDCYGYHVYKLQPTTFEMKARYCTEKAAVKYNSAVFRHVTSQNGKQYALVGHVINKEDHVGTTWKCMVHCLVEKACASFNYQRDSGVCEINNSTRSRDPDSLEERAGNEYHEKVEGLIIISDNDMN